MGGLQGHSCLALQALAGMSSWPLKEQPVIVSSAFLPAASVQIWGIWDIGDFLFPTSPGRAAAAGSWSTLSTKVHRTPAPTGRGLILKLSRIGVSSVIQHTMAHNMFSDRRGFCPPLSSD